MDTGECRCPTGDEGCPCKREGDCVEKWCAADFKVYTPGGECAGSSSGVCGSAKKMGCHCLFDENGTSRDVCID